MTNITHLLIDIDATLTESVQPDLNIGGGGKWPAGHPLNGLRSVMVAQGWDGDEADARIHEHAEKVVWWDYPDFIAAFTLPVEETWRGMEQWHKQYVRPYADAIEMVRRLHAAGRQKLFIMSNNPYCGCCMKLGVAGLADRFGSPYFTRIFGTNILHGCKCSKEVWGRAFAHIGCKPENAAIIGDNPREDAEIPLSKGAGHAFLIDRANKFTSASTVLPAAVTCVESLERINFLLNGSTQGEANISLS